MRRNLDQHIRFRQIEARIGDFADEYGIHFGVEFEVLEYLNPFILRRGPVDVGFVHFDGVVSQRVHVV